MSDHRIEDLVEDSVRLALSTDRTAGEKRVLIADLYRFQALFDTSDTLGRLADELAAIGYDDDASGSGRPLLSIVAEIMTLADQADDRQLVRDWLAVTATEIDELTLIDETLPEDFAAFHARADAIAIRQIAGRRAAQGWRGLNSYITLPSWSGLAREYQRFDPETIERRAMLRFLLDHRADADAIAADHAKDKQRLSSPDTSALNQLPEMVAARGDFRLVGHTSKDGKQTFAFEAGAPPAEPDAARFHLVIEHDRGLGVLYPSFGVRSGLLERWRGEGFAPDDASMHFSQSVIGFAPPDLLEADDGLNGMGWKWRREQSAKLLARRLDAILAYWPHAAAVQRFYATSLAERIDKEGFATLAKKRIERINQFGFFANEVDMLFACACRAWDRGARPAEEIAAIRQQLSHILPDVRGDRAACLERLEAGPAFPAPLGRFPLRRHEQTWPL